MTDAQTRTVHLLHESFRKGSHRFCYEILPAFVDESVLYYVWWGSDPDGEETAGAPDLTIRIRENGEFDEA